MSLWFNQYNSGYVTTTFMKERGVLHSKVFIHILTLHSTARYQKCIKKPQKSAQPARKPQRMSVTKPISWIQVAREVHNN
jgi:hypothetical protein